MVVVWSGVMFLCLMSAVVEEDIREEIERECDDEDGSVGEEVKVVCFGFKGESVKIVSMRKK